jgi:hypothetical protein
MVGGQSMFMIRRFLRQAGTSMWAVSYVRRFFEISEPEAVHLVAAMAGKGYIKKSENPIGGTWWEVSAGGKRVALAGAAKKISRKTADRLVLTLLHRAEEINASRDYLYRIRRITAFGAYVEGEPVIDDVDVEIELEQKEPDAKKHAELLLQRAAQEKSKGREFGSQADELGWGELEVLLYLKSRSRYLSFIQISPEWRKTLPSRVLFGGGK